MFRLSSFVKVAGLGKNLQITEFVAVLVLFLLFWAISNAMVYLLKVAMYFKWTLFLYSGVKCKNLLQLCGWIYIQIYFPAFNTSFSGRMWLQLEIEKY